MYECLHAEDKILQTEQESYENEINQFILQEKLNRVKAEKRAAGEQEEETFKEMMEFKA